MQDKRFKNEIVWVSYRDAKGSTRFVLTSKPTRDVYYLYEIADDGTPKKLGKGKSPAELEEKFEPSKQLFAYS